MNQDQQDHIIVFRDHRPGPGICGAKPLYTRDISTGRWISRITGKEPIQLGDQWDLPAGDICRNCLLLTLTIGDDAFELHHWTHRGDSAPTPTDIAEDALRRKELDETTETDAPPPMPPPPRPNPGAATPPRRNNRPPQGRKPRRTPSPPQAPRHNRKPRLQRHPVAA